MKKLITLLLAAVMCLSFTACRKNQAGADNSQGQNTENFRQDGEQTENTSDESGKPETVSEEQQTIEITLDNWQEYFEINQYLSVRYLTNDFDEAVTTMLALNTILELKEKYSDYSALGVTVQYDMDYFPSDVIYHLEDFSFQLTGCVSHPEAAVDESDFARNENTIFDVSNATGIFRHRIVDGKVVEDEIFYWNDAEMFGEESRFGVSICNSRIDENEDGTGYIEKCPTNIQITRIEGTLKYDA